MVYRCRLLILSWFTVVILLLQSGTLSAGTAPDSLQAEGAILFELNSGTVLFEQNAGRRFYPASTTKIMTALLPSGNEAAYTAAVYTAKMIEGNPDLPVDAALERFIEMMNRRAQHLGATGTRFINPDGYHHPDHYTTARDLTLIVEAFMQNQFLRQVVRAPFHDAIVWHNGEPVTRTWVNTNLLLHEQAPEYYPQATGLKTGYTTQAGGNLIAAAENETLSLIAVCLNSSAEARWNDAASLLDYGLNNYLYYQVVSAGQTVCQTELTGQASGEARVLPVLAASGYTSVFDLADLSSIERTFTWDSRLASGEAEDAVIKAPLKAGQVLGTVAFTLNGITFFETELLAGQSVRAMFPWKYGIIILTAYFLLITCRRIRRKRKRARSGRRFHR
ncbi:MAG: hypothetical protein AB1767_03675 [Bacillota bacterium]